MFFSNIKKYWHYSDYSAKAELKSEVADSQLNSLWWIIEPLCFMLIYTFIFSVVFEKKEPYFASFVMVGLSIWDFFNRMLHRSVKLISSNRDLVTKVYVPKYILLFSKSLTYLFKMMISLSLAFILMLIQGVTLSWKILYLIPILIVLYIITFGICMILMHYGVYLSDLVNLTNIFLKIVFYFSGVFYNIQMRVNGVLRTLMLKVNPVAFIMHEARNVCIYNRSPHFILLILWCLVGFILCRYGISVIHKYENSYAKVI